MKSTSTVRYAAALVAIGVSLGCDRIIPPENVCPQAIGGRAGAETVGIVFGDSETTNSTATITGVVCECLPNRHVAFESEKLKQASYTDYEIAVTASITYKLSVSDQAAYAMRRSASLRFEAVSAKGVVLGSGLGTFELVRNGSQGTASGRILGLSKETLQRVSYVTAGWIYNR